MIKFFSGTPGSGKSFHVAQEMLFYLRHKKNVISTVNIDLNKVSRNGRKKIGDFVYIPILEIEPSILYKYAIKNHKKGKEGQTLLIIDECQIIFNPREYHNKHRAEWILFFTRHRHLGYQIILISQFDRLVDRQIRALFEYEIIHRKVNNLLFFLPFTMFALIEYWYGAKVKVSKRMMFFSKSTASIYDSYVMYDDFLEKYQDKENTPETIAYATPYPVNGETFPTPDCSLGVGGPQADGGGAGRFKKFLQSFSMPVKNSRIK